MIVVARARMAAALMALALLAACGPRPTRDSATLQAIRAEALVLMANAPQGDGSPLPESRWPRTIAGLRPAFVTVDPAGVDIMTKPYFDGGWGYFVPRNPRALPEPKGRFEESGEGVYWYHPY